MVVADEDAIRRVEDARSLLRSIRRRVWSADRTIRALEAANSMAQLGKPYQWGAVGPSSFDCSGLTMTAYARAGISLPRVSRSQWYAGPHLDLADLAPGDLLFFADNLSNPATIHHVGMYVGRSLMVEAPFSGASVRLSSIGRADYIGAVRPTG